jgi:DHA2 family multidrug resistance protein
LIIKRIDHQAALLAFNEIFYFGGWAFLLLGVVLLLAKHVTFAEPDAGTRLAMEEMVEP